MNYYITFGDFQKLFTEYYLENGKFAEPTKMLSRLLKEGKLSKTKKTVTYNEDFDDVNEDSFFKIIDRFYMRLSTVEGNDNEFSTFILPSDRNVFVARHIEHTVNPTYRHDCFILNYVYKGGVTFRLEDEEFRLEEGDVCLIPPNFNRQFELDPDTKAFEIYIRSTSISNSFFNLLSRDDILSHFFRSYLRNKRLTNYLFFKTGNNTLIKKYIRVLMLETRNSDIYSDSCSVDVVNLLFVELLRRHSLDAQLLSYNMSDDFSMILKYIEKNYRTVTLDILAEHFSYSKQYLCIILKKNTGVTFVELVTGLKINDARDLLANTNLNVTEIAEMVGYNSADHFSRTFKNLNNMSPKKYREIQKKI